MIVKIVDMIKIGYVQNDPIFGDKEKNFEKVFGLCKNVKADVLVLPELFATGYTFTSQKEVEELAENSSGETTNFLKKLSKKTEAIVIAGFVEKDKNKIYNSALIVFKNKVVGIYRKIHLFNEEKK
jgi:predicted amidohydrolase